MNRNALTAWQPVSQGAFQAVRRSEKPVAGCGAEIDGPLGTEFRRQTGHRSDGGRRLAGGDPLSGSALVLEGERHARPERGDFSVLDLHVHLHDLGDAKIAQGSGGRFHRLPTGVLP